MVPEPLMSFISSKDLELRICGQININIELLMENTQYSGDYNKDSDVIKMFWEFIKNLDKKTLLKFIRFCWGQE